MTPTPEPTGDWTTAKREGYELAVVDAINVCRDERKFLVATRMEPRLSKEIIDAVIAVVDRCERNILTLLLKAPR